MCFCNKDGCTRRNVTSELREVILPSLFSTGEVIPGVLCTVLGSPVQDLDILEKVQQKITKMMKSQEHLSCE